MSTVSHDTYGSLKSTRSPAPVQTLPSVCVPRPSGHPAALKPKGLPSVWCDRPQTLESLSYPPVFIPPIRAPVTVTLRASSHYPDAGQCQRHPLEWPGEWWWPGRVPSQLLPAWHASPTARLSRSPSRGSPAFTLPDVTVWNVPEPGPGSALVRCGHPARVPGGIPARGRRLRPGAPMASGPGPQAPPRAPRVRLSGRMAEVPGEALSSPLRPQRSEGWHFGESRRGAFRGPEGRPKTASLRHGPCTLWPGVAGRPPQRH